MDIPAFPKSTVLCVIDVNDHPQQAIQVAVRAAQANNLPLTVLYPYRLIGMAAKPASKSAYDVEAREIFKRRAAPFLDESCVNCEFRAEVGFMKDRVHAFALKNHLGLLILSRATANPQEDGLNDLLDLLDVPVLIIPQTTHL